MGKPVIEYTLFMWMIPVAKTTENSSLSVCMVPIYSFHLSQPRSHYLSLASYEATAHLRPLMRCGLFLTGRNSD